MSDTTGIVLVFLLGIMVMATCVIAGGLIGRYYARKCAKIADYCAEVNERVDHLMDMIKREQDAPTDVLPPMRVDSESPLITRGQRQRASGRHRGPD